MFQNLKYYSGNDNPSITNTEYDWMPTAGKIGGQVIGSMFGPAGGMIGGAIGRDAGTDISRLAEGDNVGKIAFDRLLTSLTFEPVTGMKLPMANLGAGLLGPIAKDIFGWK